MRKDYKFRFWLKITKSRTFSFKKFVKFRGANNLDIYWLGLKIDIGMPYKHNFIYEEGYDAGFRAR